MKAILKFNLDDPEERENHLRCIKTTDLVCMIWDFDQYLHSEIEHQGKDLQKVGDELSRQMGEYNINLDELIT